MDDEIPNVNVVIGVLEAGHPCIQLPLEGHDKLIAHFEIRSRKNSGAGMRLAVHAQPMSSAVLVEFDDPNPYDFFDAVHLRLAPLLSPMAAVNQGV